MATFTAFSNILPDPANPITDAGDISPTGTPGPGFSAVGFQSVTDTQVSRTISGRGIQRDGGSQHYEFTISYNPMWRFQFDPVDAFLAGRNPRRDPFYVILPQYSKPKDSTFSTWFTNLAGNCTVSAANPGDNQLMLNFPATVQGTLKPGDMFSIQDPTDFNHQKMYKITAVEKSTYYQAGTPTPSPNQLRVKISPPLQRGVAGGAYATLINPKFRVISKSDVQEYSLNTDNLYSFSLAVEEIQP